MNQMYLVQRGKFIDREKIKTYRHPESMPMFGRDGLVKLDYMGSAEFEWGVSDSGFRMAKVYDSYVLHETMFKSIRGVPLVVFSKKDEFDEAVGQIELYLKDRTKTDQVPNYILKEPLNLEYSTIEFYYNDELKPVYLPNFWWDIKNDFMFFIGAIDRQKLFNVCIKRYFDETLQLDEK